VGSTPKPRRGERESITRGRDASANASTRYFSPAHRLSQRQVGHRSRCRRTAACTKRRFGARELPCSCRPARRPCPPMNPQLRESPVVGDRCRTGVLARRLVDRSPPIDRHPNARLAASRLVPSRSATNAAEAASAISRQAGRPRRQRVRNRDSHWRPRHASNSWLKGSAIRADPVSPRVG
jgi:hypothetical protein